MLVQEMQFLECKNEAEKLHLYEKRAIDLLNAVDETWLPEEEDDDEQEQQQEEDPGATFLLGDEEL